MINTVFTMFAADIFEKLREEADKGVMFETTAIGISQYVNASSGVLISKNIGINPHSTIGSGTAGESWYG